MLFNSLHFSIFLPVVFFIYWRVFNNNLNKQNLFLLLASYVFYGWWDWRMLGLLIGLSVLNFLIGLEIEKHQERKLGNFWFLVGLFINIGILVAFKYFDFFVDGFIDLIAWFGYDIPLSTTRMIIPIGISFYTFLSLSYLIDIKKKTLKASINILEVLLALGFFPIIIAGPIHRPSSLLTQITNKRTFNYNQCVDGLKQILWGLFTKVVIADRLAIVVDEFFLNYTFYSGSTLLIGAIFYSVQIYADFAGYSDMAIGISKLFGFKVLRNFAYPYFSVNIVEFWQKWHLSLTTWFRDYVFLPLSFSLSWTLKGESTNIFKIDLLIYTIASIITWCLTGLWHGANYTFLIWGLMHGFLLITYKATIKPRKRFFRGKGINSKSQVLIVTETFVTLFLVIIAWIFFRSDSIQDALSYLERMFSKTFFSMPQFRGRAEGLLSLFFIGLFLITDWLGRNHEYAIAELGIRWRKSFRYAFYYSIIIIIILFGGIEKQFIYMQF